MLVVAALVVGWLALMPRPGRIDRPTVDVTASADYLLASTGTRVLLPTIGAPWRPTSVRQTERAGLPGWHAGWTRPEDETAYIGLEQAASRDQGADDKWLAAAVSGRETGTTAIAGREWSVHTTDGDPVRTSLAANVEGMLVVVTGLADQQTLTQVAASLRPYERVDPVASPTS